MRHPLEFGQRRVLVDRQVRPGIGRSLQVSLEQGRTKIRRDLFEAHLLATAVT
jgi:hypothetical protein